MDEPRIENHILLGEGIVLRCPRICWDVACEGCTCATPCPEARDTVVVVEWYRMSRNRRTTNTHHIFYPRRDYTTPLERQFRELDCNKVEIDVEVHNLLHVHQSPPRKPSRGDMLAAIEHHEKRLCGCYSDLPRRNRKLDAVD